MKRKTKSKNVIKDVKTGVMIGKRTVQEVGKDQFYVNIPSEFVYKYNIKKGDSMMFIMNDSIRYLPFKENQSSSILGVNLEVEDVSRSDIEK